MAAWESVDAKRFTLFLREMRTKHEVHVENITRSTLRIFYIGDYSYRSPKAVWIAKQERIESDNYYFIAKP